MSANCSYLYVSGLRFREGDVTISAVQIILAIQDQEFAGRSVPSRLIRLKNSGALDKLADGEKSLVIRSSKFGGNMISPSEVLELFSAQTSRDLSGRILRRRTDVQVTTTDGQKAYLTLSPEGLVGRRGRQSYDTKEGLAPGRRSPDMERLANDSPKLFAALALMQVETAPKSFRNIKDATGRISDALLALQDATGAASVRSALRKSPRALAFLNGAALSELTTQDPAGMLNVARDVAEHSFWRQGVRSDAAPMLVAQLLASGAYNNEKDLTELSSLFMRTTRRANTVGDTPREGERRNMPESPILALALLSSFPAGSHQRAAADKVVGEMSSDYHGFRSSYIRDQAEEVRAFRRICHASPGASQRVLSVLSGAGLGEHDASVLLPSWQGDAGEIKRRRLPQAGLKGFPNNVQSTRGHYVGRGEDTWHSTSSPALVALAVVASHMELPTGVRQGRYASSMSPVDTPAFIAETDDRSKHVSPALRRRIRNTRSTTWPPIEDLQKQAAREARVGEEDSSRLTQMALIPAGIGDVLEAALERENAFYGASGLYRTWDPRAGADNSAVLLDIDGSTRRVYAVEGTDDALVSVAAVNIDPQHGAGTTLHPPSMAAVQAALTAPLPKKDDVITTSRPDMDSVGAMGVLLLRGAGFPLNSDARRRIDEIAREDSAAIGEWPGPVAVSDATDLVSPLAGVAAVASNFKMPLDQRAEIFAEYIYYGHAHGAEQAYNEALREAAAALGGSKVSTIDREPQHEESGPSYSGRHLPVVKVESEHRLAPKIGYAQAPVVLSVNPAFSLAGGEPHKKWTISKYNDTVPLNLAAVRDELNKLERLHGGEGTWGGSSSIIGSPQGAASLIDDDEVAEVVARHAQGRPVPAV